MLRRTSSLLLRRCYSTSGATAATQVRVRQKFIQHRLTISHNEMEQKRFAPARLHPREKETSQIHLYLPSDRGFISPAA
jgi:hypothetical protein